MSSEHRRLDLREGIQIQATDAAPASVEIGLEQASGDGRRVRDRKRRMSTGERKSRVWQVTGCSQGTSRGDVGVKQTLESL